MRRVVAAVGATVVLGLLAACGDDGAGTRTGAGSGSLGGGSGGSGSLSGQDLGDAAQTKQLQAAVDAYKTYVNSQITVLIGDTKKFTDAVRAGDVALAKQLYAPSRFAWEGIEPIAGLVPDIDGAVDSRVDDFSGPDDPTFTGWHRLEYLLWVKNTTEGGTPFADGLDAKLQTLKTEAAKVDITPKAMVLGAGDLVEEVSKGKIDGEEDRYSHTDLWDFAANIAGSKQIFTLLSGEIKAADQGLYDTLVKDFTDVETSLAKYGSQTTGFKPYGELAAADKSTMQAQLATLSEDIAKIQAALKIS